MPIPLFFNTIRIYNPLIFTLLYSLHTPPIPYFPPFQLKSLIDHYNHSLLPPSSPHARQKSSTRLQSTFCPLYASTHVIEHCLWTHNYATFTSYSSGYFLCSAVTLLFLWSIHLPHSVHSFLSPQHFPSHPRQMMSFLVHWGNESHQQMTSTTTSPTSWHLCPHACLCSCRKDRSVLQSKHPHPQLVS